MNISIGICFWKGDVEKIQKEIQIQKFLVTASRLLLSAHSWLHLKFFIRKSSAYLCFPLRCKINGCKASQAFFVGVSTTDSVSLRKSLVWFIPSPLSWSLVQSIFFELVIEVVPPPTLSLRVSGISIRKESMSILFLFFRPNLIMSFLTTMLPFHLADTKENGNY